MSVNETVEFIVDTRSAGDGQLEVIVHDSANDTLDTVITPLDEDSRLFRCVYTPIKALRHVVFISFGQVSIPHSPFRVSNCVVTLYCLRISSARINSGSASGGVKWK